MRQEGEPSVEEILESIKKVIARDNRETAQSERRRRENAGLAEPASAHEVDEILELGEAGELVGGREAGPDDEGHDPIGGDSPAADSLTTETAARAMRESLAALALIAEPGRQPQIVRSGETSLEGLAREMMRPMLADWLDRNLPEIVERLVKNEISRIAGKKG